MAAKQPPCLQHVFQIEYFAGSDGAANDIDPLAYLSDVLTRIVIRTARSISSSRGPTDVKTSKLWPENDAYAQINPGLSSLHRWVKEGAQVSDFK
jgi:hypothetical protein